jgi:class 3 adenylate cyclase
MTRETQNLTVLFADITESSRLYNQLGDAAARAAIMGCLDALTALLPRFDGRLVKTLGDAVMCVFPRAEAAMSAACEMQTHVVSHEPGGVPLRLHMGINSGAVLVEGADVFGDTVNAAAYLTNMAMAEQILLSDSTEQELPPHLKKMLRPLFSAALKGRAGESRVYQAMWRSDNLERTDVNLLVSRVLPADAGSMVVLLGDKRLRVDRWRPLITLGRDEASDMAVPDRYASRRHCSIRLVRSNFYVVDHSVNGTYVTNDRGEESHLLRGEMMLTGTGEIRLGRSSAERAQSVVLFNRDRRSQFRP